MQLNNNQQNGDESEAPTWLAYASTIWTLRSLWTLSHTKRRHDADDTSPATKEQLITLVDELLLASLKLQGRLSSEENTSASLASLEGNRFGVFMGVEAIYQILDRLSKEILYFPNMEILPDFMLQFDDIKRDWLQMIEELADLNGASIDYANKIGRLLDELAVFNLQLPKIIQTL